jgi:hypothetical protein
VYQTDLDGKHFELGTSGFLYRSNKLMYDHGTKSLWSTLEGEPVVGPLVGKGIRLVPMYAVTTTWGQWKKLHPETTVLSLETGHERDYSEGAAYREYFSEDKLMFEVPTHDPRLKDKAQVLAIRLDQLTSERLAISATFLADHPVYQDQLGDTRFVVLTDPSGANRVYEAGEIQFESLQANMAIDSDGNSWQITEPGLVQVDSNRQLKRLPAHRAFWFGWYAQFPQTRLVH